jgi:hypothetical protein
MATVQTNVVTITPTPAFTPGLRYNLLLHAQAAQAVLSGNEYDITAPFFAAQTPGVNPSVISSKVDMSAVLPTVQVKLNEAIGLGAGRNVAIGCVVYYENINLDNQYPTNIYQGEYPPSGAAGVVCPSPTPPGFDITVLTPVENAGPTTGFTDTFRFTFNGATANSACATGIATCSTPASGTKVHFVFSHVPPGSTYHRATGDLVADDMVTTIQ